MIWRAESVRDTDCGALRDHVADMLNGLAVRTDEDTTHLHEVAHGVASFCLAESQGAHVPDALLRWSMARALYTLGHEEMACALMEGDYEHRSRQEYDVLLRGEGEASELWRSCAARIVRPMPLSSFPDRSVWVADLSRLADDSCTVLDLAFYRILRRLTASLAGLWDASDGRGVLGLMLGRSVGQEASLHDGLAYIRSALEAEGTQRGWSGRPDVVYLGLPVRPRKGRRVRVAR